MLWCHLLVNTASAAPDRRTESLQQTWTTEQLLSTLAKTTPRQIDFQEEYHSTLLTTPILKTGVLTYVPPDGLEKHVLTPQQEAFAVKGDRLEYTNQAEDRDLTISLSDYPPLQVFIEGLRSIFSGDSATLDRLYQTKLDGSKRQWTLTIIPKDENMQEIVTSVLFEGRHDRLTSIVIHEASGNHSTLQLAPTH